MAEIGQLPPLPTLPEAVPRSGLSREARHALRRLLERNYREQVIAFDQGANGTLLAGRRCEVVALVLAHIWKVIVGQDQDLALFAVGGFGRGMLFPHSDVDLLVLGTSASIKMHTRSLQSYFSCLWDIGLSPGQAVRNPAQCHQLAQNDATVFTSLLDAHLLAGDPAMHQALREIVQAPDIWPSREYLAAKLADQRERHARYDDTAHNLEPNIKEGPGGLRTLDMLRWLGRRIIGTHDFEDLVEAQLLDQTERSHLAAAEATLHRYRFGLHLQADRAEERLLFDFQRDLAERLGFEDKHERNLGVEQFMQGYYRAATVIERLGTQLGERFGELLEPDILPRVLDEHFMQEGKRLAVRQADLFLTSPHTLVDAFVVRLERPDLIGFTAQTMRHIHQAVAHHGAHLAHDDNVLTAFLGLLQRGAPAAKALWRMNRFGLLAAIIPPFGKVVGRMQYDLFHVYTVDEHTVRVVSNVARFARPEAQRAFPLGYEIFNSLAHPELLILAAIFHDIAKGRGGDHSVLGESDARAFCTRMGLDADAVDMVAWLVRWHLLMSTTAQRKDITNPHVIHAFADQVGDWEHLDYLYLLTVADITGTNPKLWNSWKDRLLSDLYTVTRYALRSNPALPLRTEARVRACRERALVMLLADGFDTDEVAKVWADLPELSFLRHRPEQVAWQTAAILRFNEPLPLVEVHPLSVRGTTELFVYTPDRERLFATITATLDRQRFSVVEARVLSSRSGKALDTFLLLDSETQEPVDLERVEVLRHRMLAALKTSAEVAPSQRELSRQLRHFQLPPRIEFTHDADSSRTQIAFVCTDRPGLLACVAQVFAMLGVIVHDARIATFGERVEDFFLVSNGANGLLDDELCQVMRDELTKLSQGDEEHDQS